MLALVLFLYDEVQFMTGLQLVSHELPKLADILAVVQQPTMDMSYR